MVTALARSQGVVALVLLAACTDPAPTSGAGKLAFDPRALGFTQVPVGTTARGEVKLENEGAGILRILDVVPGPTFEGELRTEGVPAELASAGVRSISVVFTPLARGSRDGVLIFRTDATDAPDVELPIHALATVPALSVSPEVLDFGRVVIGAARTATITVRNESAAEVLLRAVTADVGTTAEIRASLGAQRRLAPGDAVAIVVRYAPVDFGPDEGRLLPVHDAGGPVSAGVRVRGEGVASEIEVAPAVVAFAGTLTGHTRSRRIVIRNVGAEPHEVRAVRVSGSAPFAVSYEGRLPRLLASAEAMSATVSYTPPIPGNDGDTLVIEASGLARPVEVPLEGEGVPAPDPVADVSPAAIDFGTVEVGRTATRAIHVTNRGLLPLVLTAPPEVVPVNAPFSTTATVARVGPSASIRLEVQLTPIAASVEPGALQIRTNDLLRPLISIPLTGRALRGPVEDLVSAPSALRFGLVPAGARVSRVAHLTSAGSATVTIFGVALDRGVSFALDPLPVFPVALPPGSSLPVRVRAIGDAGGPGARTDTLLAESDDPDPGALAVPITLELAPPEGALPALEVRLARAGGAGNLDLHLIRTGGRFGDLRDDAGPCNPNPDWGVAGHTGDDPLYGDDVLEGDGEESIAVRDPEDGNFRVLVHYPRGPGGVVEAAVTVRSRGVERGTAARALLPGMLWEAGTVSYGRGTGLSNFDRPVRPLLSPPDPACD